jgi:hypothetical protein
VPCQVVRAEVCHRGSVRNGGDHPRDGLLLGPAGQVRSHGGQYELGADARSVTPTSPSMPSPGGPAPAGLSFTAAGPQFGNATPHMTSSAQMTYKTTAFAALEQPQVGSWRPRGWAAWWNILNG